jgi:hypothetical protein
MSKYVRMVFFGKVKIPYRSLKVINIKDVISVYKTNNSVRLNNSAG